MTREQRAKEIEDLRRRIQIAMRQRKHKTVHMLFMRLHDCVIRQLRIEITEERRRAA